MDKKEKKKEELIGKLLGRYADQKGISIIKIGKDTINQDTLERLNKANAKYRDKIERLNNTKNENTKRIRELLETSQKQQEDLIETHRKEIENLNKQIVELNKEIDIRREEDSRFKIMDL